MKTLELYPLHTEKITQYLVLAKKKRKSNNDGNKLLIHYILAAVPRKNTAHFPLPPNSVALDNWADISKLL